MEVTSGEKEKLEEAIKTREDFLEYVGRLAIQDEDDMVQLRQPEERRRSSTRLSASSSSRRESLKLSQIDPKSGLENLDNLCQLMDDLSKTGKAKTSIPSSPTSSKPSDSLIAAGTTQ